MTRPLLITDCDEVLLHMVSHFAEWLDEDHAIDFDLSRSDFAGALSDRATGETLTTERVWPLLDLFFREEMGRQTVVPGAIDALERIGAVADIVILTNLIDEAHPWRVEQLAGHGIAHEVVCNQGGKGPPVRALARRHDADVVVFVDDLPVHHKSVAEHAPEVWRLHMIAEPKLAVTTPPSPHAHARIDDWPSACEWILSKFEEVR
ncbi:HAD family hydrolase [Sphingomonas piscis]|uniref:HAD family hydrolase n=1 Tax=Sphingomonas piscis TaxID=2714943 RepID=A0A6G7YPX5_9SPHN|nr:HAD family hydrolase [Sphingomonas piscis]QIK78795.1 HAD family hydrolase [Sphingomonas piscis]